MKRRVEDLADITVYAPLEELTDSVKRNPRRKRSHVMEFGEDYLYGGNSSFLVRTAIVRSENYGETKAPAINNPGAAARLCRHLADSDQEHLVVLSLDSAMKLRAIYETAIGATSGVGQEAKHIIKVPLLVSASAIVLVHNHPSGDPRGSTEDAAMSERIDKALDCVGIRLMDFVVVASRGFYSGTTGEVITW